MSRCAGQEVNMVTCSGGGEVTIAGMDDDELLEIGRKTYAFARRVMRNPELRTLIKARAAEIRANGEYR